MEGIHEDIYAGPVLINSPSKYDYVARQILQVNIQWRRQFNGPTN